MVTLREWRPPKKHPRVWKQLNTLIQAGRLIAPEEVYAEIRKGQDALHRWATRRNRETRFFRKATRQQINIAKEILRTFPDLVDYDKPGPEDADPFVVALAVDESKGRLGIYEHFVIAEEKFTPHGKARIPHVCEEYGLQYLSIHQMFLRLRAEEDWKF